MGWSKNNLNSGDTITNTAVDNWDTGIDEVTRGVHNYGASSGGTDTYAISFSTAFTAYVTGMKFSVKVDVSNTGASTLNVDSLGAKAIKVIDGDGKRDTETGDMVANGIYDFEYDGTDFILKNPIGGRSTGWTLLTQTTVSGSDAAQVDLTSISSDYTDFELVVEDGESDGSTTDLYIQFNSDSTSSNYRASAAGQATSDTFPYFDDILQSTQNYKGFGIARISDISGSYTNLIIHVTSSNGSAKFSPYAGTWESTSKITSINLVPASGNIKVGTKISLYGRV